MLVATTNPGKLREIVALLNGPGLELRTLADFARLEPPEETGRTFADNARAKALYYAEWSGLPTVAEDSGLEIDALGGVPGVESARFGGVDASYSDRFALIDAALRVKGTRSSQARFVCALALAKGQRVLFEARGTVEGQIAPEPRGQGGFGYDPIFFYPPFSCTLAEAGDRKSTVSHRGEAFRKLRAFLKTQELKVKK